VLVLAVYLCTSPVPVVGIFSGPVLFPLQCSVLPFLANALIFFKSSFVISSKCLKNEVIYFINYSKQDADGSRDN